MTQKEIIDWLDIIAVNIKNFPEISADKKIEALQEAIKIIKKTPKLKGVWQPVENSGYADGNPVYDVWECSQCGYEHKGEKDTLTAYCPDCGANMIEL